MVVRGVARFRNATRFGGVTASWQLRLLLAVGLTAALLFGWSQQPAVSSPANTGGQAGGPSADRGSEPQPRVNWHPCGDGFECATVPVPLDHEDRSGRIQLRLIRLPASGDPDQRLGSLFTNPGGPGGSGVDFVRGVAEELVPEQVRARYDIVGFDPRGIARSTGLRCYGSERQAAAALAPFFIPFTEEQFPAYEASLVGIASNCDQRGGRILDHMTTANVARDLDVLREAVGDDQLHYLGLSYGSQLGNTYLNLFPDNVGRVVLDGIVDPVAWTVGREGQEGVPTFIRIGSAAGAEETLGEFTRLCDEAAAAAVGATACPLGTGSEQRLEAILAGLRELPDGVPGVPDPLTGEQAPLTYDMALALLQFALDNPVAWSPVAQIFAVVEAELTDGPDPARRAEVATLSSQIEQMAANRRWLPRYPGAADIEWRAGVTCADSTNHPATFAEWPAAVEAAVDEFGLAAESWAWLDSQCVTWPGQGLGRYAGDEGAWNAETPETVLLLSSRFDASTPYAAAETVDDLLPNSQLVTYEGWGHLAIANDLVPEPDTGLSCTMGVVTDYLLDGSVPEEDPRCEAAPSPFLQPLGVGLP